jgi:hypothetical protein
MLIYFLENNYNNIDMSVSLLTILKRIRKRNSTCSTCYRDSQISEGHLDTNIKDLKNKKDLNNKELPKINTEDNNLDLESEVFPTTDDEINIIPNIFENLRNSNRYKKVNEDEALKLREILKDSNEDSNEEIENEDLNNIKKRRRFQRITNEEEEILNKIFKSTIPILFLKKYNKMNKKHLLKVILIILIIIIISLFYLFNSSLQNFLTKDKLLIIWIFSIIKKYFIKSFMDNFLEDKLEQIELKNKLFNFEAWKNFKIENKLENCEQKDDFSEFTTFDDSDIFKSTITMFFFYSNLNLKNFKESYIKKIKYSLIKTIYILLKKIVKLIFGVFYILKLIIKRILILSVIWYIKDFYILSDLSSITNLFLFEYYEMLNSKIILKYITSFKNLSLNLRNVIEYFNQILEFLENKFSINKNFEKDLTNITKNMDEKEQIVLENYKLDNIKELDNKPFYKNKIIIFTGIVIFIGIIYLYNFNFSNDDLISKLIEENNWLHEENLRIINRHQKILEELDKIIDID